VRHLVICDRCRRQLDAGERLPGDSLRCPCGAEVQVPEIAAHDSAVVRCSACGAPRSGDEAACRYCGSDFTVHERDLDTICPGCMARVSGAARFCSHCGSPILADQAAAGLTPLPCPACGGGRLLTSRRLASEPVAVSECEVCGGIWTDKSVFEILVARVRHAQLSVAALALKEPLGGQLGESRRLSSETAAGNSAHRLYRPCATCAKLMNRLNFGRMSGVIVDVCAPHGLWFDLDELPRLLRWIGDGGEQRARRLEVEEATATARQHRLEQENLSGAGGGSLTWPRDDDTFTVLLSMLGDGVRQLFHRL
jgi:DNA-directed RNA polymerase subunit RPC12/RpoP